VYFLSVVIPPIVSECGLPLEALQSSIEAAHASQQNSLRDKSPSSLSGEVVSHLVLPHRPGKEYAGYVGGGGYCPQCLADMPRTDTHPTDISTTFPLLTDITTVPYKHWCISTTRFCCDAPPRAV